MYTIDFGNSRAILLNTEFLYDHVDNWKPDEVLQAAEGHYRFLECDDIIHYGRHVPPNSNILIEYAHGGIPASQQKKCH
jgi:hypothetical protein